MARKSETVIEEEPVKTHHHPKHSEAASDGGFPQAQTASTSEEAPAPAAGQPTPFAVPMPPPLGKTPTSIKQMMPNSSSTTTRATHFTGPVVCGPPPGSTAVGGAAICTLALQLDYSMGNFSLPVQFPPGALLLWAISIEYAAFTAAPSISLGRTSGAADILAADALGLTADATQIVPVTGALPFPWETVTGGAPGQAFLNVTGNTANTAGGAFLLFAYVMMARPWN